MNRQVMLRLVNHSPRVYEKYNSIVREVGVDEALKICYDFFIEDGEDFEIIMKYESLFDPEKGEVNLELVLMKDTPNVSAIRMIAEQIGWREFMFSLIRYANKKAAEKAALGLHEDAQQWTKIADKFATVRKTVSF